MNGDASGKNGPDTLAMPCASSTVMPVSAMTTAIATMASTLSVVAPALVEREPSPRPQRGPRAPSLRRNVHRCAHRRRDEDEGRGVCQQPDGRVVVGGGDGEALSRREAGVVEGQPQAADGLSSPDPPARRS